jgi:hypothetical protein
MRIKEFILCGLLKSIGWEWLILNIYLINDIYKKLWYFRGGNSLTPIVLRQAVFPKASLKKPCRHAHDTAY